MNPADGPFVELAEALGMADAPEGLEAFASAAAEKARDLVKAERDARQAMETLRAAGIAVAQNLAVGDVLEELLDYLNWIVPYDGARVVLSEKGGLYTRASRDYSCHDGAEPGLVPCEPSYDALIGRVMNYKASAVDENGGGARLAVPLVWGDEALGVVVVERAVKTGFAESHLRLAEAFASQGAVAIRNARLFEDLRRADAELVASYDATIEGWSRALELRDHDTEGHTLRVTDITVALAKRMGFPEDKIVHLRRGALLHDIGKVGIPDSILLKPEPLDREERLIMMRHARYAFDLLKHIDFLKPALDIPYCHHEKWDGSGYPQGLKSTQIPLAARVFMVADVWDALIYDRPYHRAWEREDARTYMASLSGIHFDPVAVAAFLDLELELRSRSS